MSTLVVVLGAAALVALPAEGAAPRIAHTAAPGTPPTSASSAATAAPATTAAPAPAKPATAVPKPPVPAGKPPPPPDRLTRLEEEVAKLRADLAAASARLADAEALRTELTMSAAAAGKRIEELSAEIAALRKTGAGPESAPVEAVDPAALEAAVAEAEHRLTELELRVADDEGRFVLGGLGGFKLSGNVVTAIWYRNSSDVTAAGEVVDANDEFTLVADSFELDIEAAFGTLAVVRADVDVMANWSSTGGSDFVLSLEQAWAEMRIPILKSIPIRLGRWSDEIGWEPVDRAGLWGFTHSNVFTLMQPGLLTGLRVGYAPVGWLDVAAMMVNGIGDNVDVKNLAKTFAGSVEIGSPRKGSAELRTWKINLGFLVGSEQPAAVDPERNYLDATILATLAFDFRIGGLLLGGQLAYMEIHDGQLNIEAHQGRNAAYGGEVAARYDLAMRLSAWGRYDLVFDERGVFSDRGLLMNGAGLLHGLSVGMGLTLTEGARVGLEYRAELFLATDPSAEGPSCRIDGERRPCGRTSGEDGAAHTAVLHFTFEF